MEIYSIKTNVVRKIYRTPEVLLVALDYSISLVMKSHPDKPPKPPKPGSPQGMSARDPFASPFANGAFD